MPQQAPESAAIYYLFVGSFILSLGVLPIGRKISGSFLARFLMMLLFVYVCFGISNSLQGCMYSNARGQTLMALVLLLPIVLFSFVSAVLVQSNSVSRNFIELANGVLVRQPGAQQETTQNESRVSVSENKD